MKILVCGDRKWSDQDTMLRVLRKIREKQDNCKGIVTVIHGAAKGADSMAGKIANSFAKSHAWRVKPFSANWKKFGNSAGPIRNRQMLKEKPDLVLAFHNNLKKSKGTLDMVQIALETGARVKLYKKNDKKA